MATPSSPGARGWKRSELRGPRLHQPPNERNDIQGPLAKTGPTPSRLRTISLAGPLRLQGSPHKATAEVQAPAPLCSHASLLSRIQGSEPHPGSLHPGPPLLWAHGSRRLGLESLVPRESSPRPSPAERPRGVQGPACAHIAMVTAPAQVTSLPPDLQQEEGAVPSHLPTVSMEGPDTAT